MHGYSRHYGPRFTRFTLLFLLTFGLLLGLVTGENVLAQIGTPTASACQRPEPAFAPDFPPIANSQATPTTVATPPSANEPVDQGTIDAIDFTIAAVAACQTDHAIDMLLTLTTEHYLGQAYGGGQRLSHEDYRLLASQGPTIPMQILDVANYRFSGMQTVSADVTFVAGNQLRKEEWTFLLHHEDASASDGTGYIGTPSPETGTWLLHEFSPLTIDMTDQGFAQVPVTISEYSLTLPVAPIGSPNVVLVGTNQGKETHEMLVLKLDPGASASDLLDPDLTAFPAGINVVGQATVPSGMTAQLILVDLAPGSYSIVSLLPSADGVPQLALGEEATFTVR